MLQLAYPAKRGSKFPSPGSRSSRTSRWIKVLPNMDYKDTSTSSIISKNQHSIPPGLSVNPKSRFACNELYVDSVYLYDVVYQKIITDLPLPCAPNPRIERWWPRGCRCWAPPEDGAVFPEQDQGLDRLVVDLPLGILVPTGELVLSTNWLCRSSKRCWCALFGILWQVLCSKHFFMTSALTSVPVRWPDLSIYIG